MVICYSPITTLQSFLKHAIPCLIKLRIPSCFSFTISTSTKYNPPYYGYSIADSDLNYNFILCQNDTGGIRTLNFGFANLCPTGGHSVRNIARTSRVFHPADSDTVIAPSTLIGGRAAIANHKFSFQFRAHNTFMSTAHTVDQQV